MIENTIVALVVAIAAFFIGRRIVRRIRDAWAGKDVGCGHAGCPREGSCGGQHRQP